MLRSVLFSLSLFCVSAADAFSFKFPSAPRYALKSGDIVFQDTGGQQGEAIKAATHSNFTHCGVLFEENGKLYVFEAVQPVCVTPLAEWKARSKIFHARRLKDPQKLTPAAFVKASKWAQQQLGKSYDPLFQWDNENLYCSELVWKVYKEATGISLCEPKSFQSYFLNDPAVSKVITQRYGDVSKLPREEPVVAPSDLASSSMLEEVPLLAKK